MHRRSGWRRASRLAGACALALVLAACPGSKPSTRLSPSDSPGPTRPAGTRGGELVVAYPHEPPTLNPFLAAGASPATRDLARLLMPSFWRIGPEGRRTLSLLAEEPVTAESGGQLLIGVRFRDDAVWSDGRPITTTDLRFTWTVLRDRRFPVTARQVYDRITDVRVESPKAATLVFAEPYAAWRDLFSSGAGLLPEHVLRNSRFDVALAGGWPVSGGPFVLKTWTRGLEMVLERNPETWGDEPYLDRVRIQFLPDVVTALALLRSGKVDVLGPYAGVDLERRGKLVSGAAVTSDFGTTWMGLFLNVKTAALSDVRVRRALAFSLNRAAITEGIVRAEGKELNALSAGGEIPASSAFAQYRADTAAATRLLAQAGWSGSGTRSKGGRDLTFTVVAPPDELTDRVARALHANAERAGFDLNAITLDYDRLWRDWLSSSRFQAALLEMRDAPGGTLQERFAMGSPGNLSRLSDLSLDTLLDAAVAGGAFDAAAVAAAERRLAQLVPAIPLYRNRVTIVAGKNARNVVANGSADGFLWNAADWSRA